MIFIYSVILLDGKNLSLNPLTNIDFSLTLNLQGSRAITNDLLSNNEAVISHADSSPSYA